MSALHFFEGYTLVDITPTGKIRSNTNDDNERNQQRNWETVLQCISLRVQPVQIKPPVMFDTKEVHLENAFDFGDMYTGSNQHVWFWTWAVEHDGVYDLPNKPLGGLYADFEQVPIITILDETARFMLPIFYPYGSIKNVYFRQVTTR
jgi:hypothetical protein